VVVTPAQLDGRGAVNLSGIGGTPDRPGVALPGHRGLAENNDSPSTVVYLLTSHTPRALVDRVDVESGPPPSEGRHRALLTPLGHFALEPGTGWRIVSLTPGVTVDDVAAATGFALSGDGDAPVTPPPTDEERAALAAVDPHGVRALAFLERHAAAARMAEIAAAERQLSAAPS
jgi:acyl CoA:acetate/3-ketoacid CoA transferase beta subunit